MIDIKPKIHDSNTLEFKVGFLPNDGKTYDDFYMNTWIFIPERLDVNKHTYSKDTFYCDTLSYLRLITPRYELRVLAAVVQNDYPLIFAVICCHINNSCARGSPRPT